MRAVKIKKKIILFFAVGLFFVPLSSQGQILISLLFGDKLNSGKVEFGLVGGLNLSTLRGMEDPKYNHTFGLGMYFDYNISKHWVAGAEINLKTKLGAKNITMADAAFAMPDSLIGNSDKTLRTINVIQVPITISYRFTNGFGFGGGFYSSIIHGSRDYFYYKEGSADITYQQSFTDQLKSLEIGLTGALFYHFTGNPGMQIRARVNYGLTNIYVDSSNLTGKNLWFSVGVAVPIMVKF